MPMVPPVYLCGETGKIGTNKNWCNFLWGWLGYVVVFFSEIQTKIELYYFQWRKFKSRKPIGEFVVVSHGWQSEDTDETPGGGGLLSFSLAFFLFL